MDGHDLEAELPGRRQAGVPNNHDALGIDHDRLPEAEL